MPALSGSRSVSARDFIWPWLCHLTSEANFSVQKAEHLASPWMNMHSSKGLKGNSKMFLLQHIRETETQSPTKNGVPPKYHTLDPRPNTILLKKKKQSLADVIEAIGMGVLCIPVRGRGKRIWHTERRLCKETAGETRDGWYWEQGHKLRDVWQLILIDNLMECGIS